MLACLWQDCLLQNIPVVGFDINLEESMQN